MYLFISADSQELDKSINCQLAQSELWQKLTAQNNNNTITSNNSGVDTGKTAQDKASNSKSILGLGRFPSTVSFYMKSGKTLYLFVLVCSPNCPTMWSQGIQTVRHFLLWIVFKHSDTDIKRWLWGYRADSALMWGCYACTCVFQISRSQCSGGEDDSEQPGPKPHCKGLNPTSSRSTGLSFSRYDHQSWDAAPSNASPTGAPPGVWRWTYHAVTLVLLWFIICLFVDLY